MTKNLLKRDVTRLHDAYAMAMARWGENNQATLNALVYYHEARRAWEAQTGKSYLAARADRTAQR